MDGLEQFQTDEFFRYAAECRRLARLSRGGLKETGRAEFASNWRRYTGWLDQHLATPSAVLPRRATVAGMARSA